MTWYIIGMVITYFSATNEEISSHTWGEIMVVLLIWPIAFGLMINDLRWELEHAREHRRTLHENRS